MGKVIEREMQGVITKQLINKDYFILGDAYRLHIGTNHFVNAILREVGDDYVEFDYLDIPGLNGTIKCANHTFKRYTCSELFRCDDTDIVHMTPDYAEGKLWK
jgi:hypothetical protein